MFALLDRVRITDGSHKGLVGYITGERGGKLGGGMKEWKVTVNGADYWVPEPWLEKA